MKIVGATLAVARKIERVILMGWLIALGAAGVIGYAVISSKMSSNNGEENLKEAAKDMKPEEMWCSRCKRCEVMLASEGGGYYCTGTGNGNPYNDAHNETNPRGSTIIGYTSDDINIPCCNGNYFIPNNPYNSYDIKFYGTVEKLETY